MTIYIPPHIKVVVVGENYEIRHSQNLYEYIHKPSIELQMATYGKTLLDVLIEESYIAEDFVLKHIFTGDAHADATRMIGSIAESLVVDFCNKYPEVNRTLGKYARLGQVKHKILDRYVAVATGSMRTKINYPQHYNPNDTQRDVIWVEKDNIGNQLLCIGSNFRPSGKPAGLQVKASHDGIKYVVPTIKKYHYPILYFDLNGDWGEVQKNISHHHPKATVIHPDEIQYEIKRILLGYFDIVVALLRNEVTVQQVIEASKYNGDSVISLGIDGAEVNQTSKIILPPSLHN